MVISLEGNLHSSMLPGHDCPKAPGVVVGDDNHQGGEVGDLPAAGAHPLSHPGGGDGEQGAGELHHICGLGNLTMKSKEILMLDVLLTTPPLTEVQR